jgi:hypothetical protein
MTPDETLRELNTCFHDWQGFLANKNATLRGKVLAWPNYVPHIEKNVTWETVTLLASNRQYSFQLLDGSIVQMLYDFSAARTELKSAMLAYYQNRIEEEADEDTEGEVLPLDDDLSSLPPKWIRMDFGAREDGNSIHADCHLHLSGFPDTRISCAGVPGPRQFLESLLAWLYPDHYRNTVLSKGDDDLKVRFVAVNRVCLHAARHEQFNSLLHLTLPPSVRFPEGKQ